MTYLPQQLSRDHSVQTGDTEDRVANRVASAHRVGLRLSPASLLNDIQDDDYRDTYRVLTKALAKKGLAYLHIMEASDRDFTKELRTSFGGTFILNPATPDGVTGPGELGIVEDGTADLLSFGALFLATRTSHDASPPLVRSTPPIGPASTAAPITATTTTRPSTR